MFNGKYVDSERPRLIPDHSCTEAGTIVHLSVYYFPQASIFLPVINEETKSEGALN